MRKKSRLLLSLCMVLVLALGSVVVVDASYSVNNSAVSPISVGDVYSFHEPGYTDPVEFKVLSFTGSTPIYILGITEPDNHARPFAFASMGSFSIRFSCKGTTTTITSSSYSYGGQTFYATGYMTTVLRAGTVFSYPVVLYSGTSWTDALGSFIVGDGSAFDEVIFPPAPPFDYTEGTLNTKLGYLEGLKEKTLRLKNFELLKGATWKNTHSEWDDSYKVAHYIKFYGFSTGVPLDTQRYESKRYLIQSVNYSDCESLISYDDENFKAGLEEFKAYMDSLDLPSYTNYSIGHEHWFLIYHETEDGTEYGYWTELRTATSGGYNSESGYGFDDAEGNYTEVGDLGEVEHIIGSGDDKEDAENNSEVYYPESDYDADDANQMGDNLISMLKNLVGSVGQLPQIIGNFFQFLPSEIVGMIALGLAMILVLRILGR